MKFSAMLVFMGVWFTLVYAPIAHMVWGGDGGLMWDWGVLDFAGGTVVHINAGIAGLVACLVLGKRKGYPTTPMAPHNLGLTLVGAAMLWVGWFGFNAGSAIAANGTAGMAMLVTQIATAAAALGWVFAEWIGHGKPSALGIASGVVAGLVAITRSEEHTSELQSLMRISYAVFCLKNKIQIILFHRDNSYLRLTALFIITKPATEYNIFLICDKHLCNHN